MSSHAERENEGIFYPCYPCNSWFNSLQLIVLPSGSARRRRADRRQRNDSKFSDCAPSDRARRAPARLGAGYFLPLLDSSSIAFCILR